MRGGSQHVFRVSLRLAAMDRPQFAALHKKTITALSSLGFCNANYISAQQSFITIFKSGNTANGIRKAEVTYHILLILFPHVLICVTVDQNSLPFSRLINFELGSSVNLFFFTFHHVEYLNTDNFL